MHNVLFLCVSRFLLCQIGQTLLRTLSRCVSFFPFNCIHNFYNKCHCALEILKIDLFHLNTNDWSNWAFFKQRYSLTRPWALLEFLLRLPEEVTSVRLGANRRKELMEQFKRVVPEMNHFLTVRGRSNITWHFFTLSWPPPPVWHIFYLFDNWSQA